MRRKEAKFIFEEIISNFGVPKIIQTDRWTHFDNELFEKLADLLEFKHHKSASYNSQTNGLTERFNGTLYRGLAKIAEEYREHRSVFIRTVLFAYRCRKQENIQFAQILK